MNKEKIKTEIWTILGLINCNVGLGVLVVPVVAINAGYIPLVVITLGMALLAYYTARIVVAHQCSTGQAGSIKQMMEHHFGANSLWYSFYVLALIASIFTLLVINFQLLIRQSVGLLPTLNSSRFGFSFFLFIFLFVVTAFIKYFKISMKFLGVGILGTFCLLGFFIWLIFSFLENEASSSLETQTQPFPAVGGDIVSLISILITANSIHNVITPVLQKGASPESYSRVIKLAFLGSAVVYLLAGFSCVGLISKKSVTDSPQTFYDYFQPEQFSIKVVYFIFTYRFLTVCPQLCIILSSYFFEFVHELTKTKSFSEPQDLELDATEVSQQQNLAIKKNNISFRDFVFFAMVYGLSFLISNVDFNLKTMSALRGALISSIVTFLMPLAIHIKCKFFKKQNMTNKVQHENAGQTHASNSSQGNSFLGYCQRKQKNTQGKKILEGLLIGFIISLCLICSVIQIYTQFSHGDPQPEPLGASPKHFMLRHFQNNLLQ